MEVRDPDKPWRLLPWMTTRKFKERWQWLTHLWRVFPCCTHCGHNAPSGGSETKIPGIKYHTVPCAQCQIR